MAHELSDAMNNEKIEVAVVCTLWLHSRQRETPLRSLAWRAVEETFCLCVTEVVDAVERRLSAMHAALVCGILHRAEKRLVDSA